MIPDIEPERVPLSVWATQLLIWWLIDLWLFSSRPLSRTLLIIRVIIAVVATVVTAVVAPRVRWRLRALPAPIQTIAAPLTIALWAIRPALGSARLVLCCHSDGQREANGLVCTQQVRQLLQAYVYGFPCLDSHVRRKILEFNPERVSEEGVAHLFGQPVSWPLPRWRLLAAR